MPQARGGAGVSPRANPSVGQVAAGMCLCSVLLLLYGVMAALHDTWLLLDGMAATLELAWRGTVGCRAHGMEGHG